jgi:hypothetical protein
MAHDRTLSGSGRRAAAAWTAATLASCAAASGARASHASSETPALGTGALRTMVRAACWRANAGGGASMYEPGLIIAHARGGAQR